MIPVPHIYPEQWTSDQRRFLTELISALVQLSVEVDRLKLGMQENVHT